MGISAPYVDGKLEMGNASMKSEEPKAGNSVDKEAFLQLLVAQMKYQDPLQPTSNTEYISQYATFSELEQMQNMSSSMTLSRASELVGKEVLVESESESGKVTQVQGKVEKVVYQSNKAYLSIDGALYSMDDLKLVIDDEFSKGTKTIEEIQKIVDKLPPVEELTMSDLADVLTVYNLCAGMSDYQASMMSKELEEQIQKYISKMNELVENSQSEEPKTETV
ncbi:MAG: flagellar hook capping protein [Lachnospiraceae bacterium]|nr:flagellar hook capping protein [Lachnospiraceae bacterium]